MDILNRKKQDLSQEEKEMKRHMKVKWNSHRRGKQPIQSGSFHETNGESNVQTLGLFGIAS